MRRAVWMLGFVALVACGGSEDTSTTATTVVDDPAPDTTATTAVPTTTTTSPTGLEALEPFPDPPDPGSGEGSGQTLVWAVTPGRVVGVDVEGGTVVAESAVPSIDDADVGFGSVWLVSCEEGVVLRLDDRDLAEVGRWETGGCPTAIAATEGGAFVLDVEAQAVLGIDGALPGAEPVVVVDAVGAVAFDAGSPIVFATPGDPLATVSLVEATPFGPGETIWETQLNGEPLAAFVHHSPFGPAFYVLFQPPGDVPPFVAVLDPADGTILDSWDPAPGEIAAFLVSEDLLVLGDAAQGVRVFDTETDEEVLVPAPDLEDIAAVQPIGGETTLAVAAGDAVHVVTTGAEEVDVVDLGANVAHVVAADPPPVCPDREAELLRQDLLERIDGDGHAIAVFADEIDSRVETWRRVADQAERDGDVEEADRIRAALDAIEELFGQLSVLELGLGSLADTIGRTCDVDELAALTPEVDDQLSGMTGIVEEIVAIGFDTVALGG
ncbi:MAG: hypothetical protein R3290_00120 [Acidimicrobiia bacterium]|nr:hypothetical protein [Acidimicrobiia bacterium]